MRVIHAITLGVDMGGSQTETYLLLRQQSGRHEVALVVGTDGPLKEACQAAGIPVHVVAMTNKLLSPVADARTLLALIRHFRRARPDLLHTHGGKAGIVGRFAARLARIPAVVHTFHGPLRSSPQAAGGAGSPLARRVGLGAVRLVERICAGLTDQIVAVSTSTAEELVAARVCPANRVRVVVSGIDFSRFPVLPFERMEVVRASLGATDGQLLVVGVGHLFENKAHDLLIRSAAELHPIYPTVRYAIVGTGPAEPRLRELIAHAGMVDVVRLAGNRDDVPEILASADIYVQTSRLEGLSRSVVEAMYAGLAVVATDAGGTREVVHDGETGLLVPVDAPSELAAALSRLIREPALRRALGDRAHDEVATSRTVEVMGGQLEAIYDEIATRKGILAGRRW